MEENREIEIEDPFIPYAEDRLFPIFLQCRPGRNSHYEETLIPKGVRKGFLIAYQTSDSIIKPFLSLLLYLLERRIALWKLEVQLVGQTRKSRRVMESNATDEVNHYEIEEGDDPQHTQYITWPGQDADDNQRPILQPVSGNGGRKLKGKAETRHSAKERSTNLTALKLFAWQGAEKSQLEEWKADLLQNLTSEIAQIHKAHNDAMEAQREETERQRKQFQFVWKNR